MTLDLPETLLKFLHTNIPSFQAADALLFFAQNRDRDFSAVRRDFQTLRITGLDLIA